jgi:P4 family phage/plasmid primase-like protien
MLDFYLKNEFKLFKCLPDKSPEKLPIEENLVTLQDAKTLQDDGNLIGALIPKGMIVINIGRDFEDEKKDGSNIFKEIRKELGIEQSPIDYTFVVMTPSKGFHIFFKTPRGQKIESGIRAENIEIKADGYVICPGKNSYSPLNTLSAADADARLLKWVIETPVIKKAEIIVSNTIPARTIKSIFKKIKTEEIKNLEYFLMSAIASIGRNNESMCIIADWICTAWDCEPLEAMDRLENMDIKDGISVQNFINYLSHTELSKHLLKKIINHDAITDEIINNQALEIHLPIDAPDYEKISKSPMMHDFFNLMGHSRAANLLMHALKNKVIYVKKDGYYYFGGSRWEPLYNILQITYTILSIVSRMYWRDHKDEKSSVNDAYYELSKSLNDTHFKSQVLREFSEKTEVFRKEVKWDSPDIKETLTTEDGVIDFRNGDLKERVGEHDEYRRSYIPIASHYVMEAEKPVKFISFLKEIFPDKGTFETARFVLSMFASGNSGRRLFHLWEGNGANGKSTLIDIMQRVLGDDKCTTYPASILLPDVMAKNSGTTPELDRFLGKYCAFGIEVEEGKRFSSGVVKQLTGGDTITVNPKYKEAYEMRPTWQLVLAVNDMPGFDTSDNAFIERLCVLPFNAKFCKDERDRKKAIDMGMKADYVKLSKDRIKLVDEIKEEREGILRYLIESYVELERDHRGIIPQSPECLEKKDCYITDNDDYTEFVETCCVLDKNGVVFYKKLTNRFREYINNDRIKTNTVTKNILLKFKNRGVYRDVRYNDSSSKERCLRGIRLREEMDKGREDGDQEIPF